MLSHEKKEALLSLFSEKQVLIQNPSGLIHNYQSLKAEIVQQEFRLVINALKALLEEDPDNFPELFKAQWQKREELNANSGLSITAMPHGVCNVFCWQIAVLLFQPATLGEMLSQLTPKVITELEPELYLDLSENATVEQIKVVSKYPSIRFKLLPLSFSNLPATLEALEQVVVAEPYCFDLGNLETLSFDQHLKLYELLQREYPELAVKVYQHNKALKTLSAQLESVSNQGETPYIVIRRFIQDLRLGGETMTGEYYASLDAQQAYHEFVDYIETLPDTFKEELLDLKTNDGQKNLNDVYKHLSAGHCIEQAAKYLQAVLDNQANQTLLNTRPLFSDQQMQTIKQQYSHGSTILSLAIKGNDPAIQFPAYYLENSLRAITINNVYDYLSILLSFPPTYYSSLLHYATIHCSPLPPRLGEMIADGIFNSEQLKAFNQAIIDNLDKMGGLATVMKFALRYNSQLLETDLITLPLEQRLAAVKEEDSDEESVLHLAVGNSGALQIILRLYPKTERLAIVTERDNYDNSVLHLAANKPASLKVILQSLPKAERFPALKQKNNFGKSALIQAAGTNESLRAIFHSLSSNEALWDVYQQIDDYMKKASQSALIVERLKRFAVGKEGTQVSQGLPFFPSQSSSVAFPSCLQDLTRLKPDERSMVAQLFLTIKNIDYEIASQRTCCLF